MKKIKIGLMGLSIGILLPSMALTGCGRYQDNLSVLTPAPAVSMQKTQQPARMGGILTLKNAYREAEWEAWKWDSSTNLVGVSAFRIDLNGKNTNDMNSQWFFVFKRKFANNSKPPYLEVKVDSWTSRSQETFKPPFYNLENMWSDFNFIKDTDEIMKSAQQAGFKDVYAREMHLTRFGGFLDWNVWWSNGKVSRIDADTGSIN